MGFEAEMNELLLRPIAYIKTDLPDKFGVPRQSGLVPCLKGTIVFEKEFRDENAVRGLEEYSHLWLLWGFSENKREEWQPTVRPPRLGGNKRVGVFATRSPYRPNPVGLTVVKLEGMEKTADGMVIRVSGVDMTDGTPIYDIKPYLQYVDSIPEANNGFALAEREGLLEVECPEEFIRLIPEDKREALADILGQDPRPQYQDDPQREYRMEYAGVTVRFQVKDDVLKVTGIE